MNVIKSTNIWHYLPARASLMFSAIYPKSDDNVPLADQAVNWLLLLRSECVSKQEQLAFQRWRESDPRHERAWQTLSGAVGPALSQLDGPSLDFSRPLTLSFAHHTVLPRNRAALRRRRFLINTLGLATVAGVALLLADAHYPLHNFFADIASGTGERRQFQLADGSDLLLDARSRIKIDFTPERRHIQLLAGAMSVEVAAHANRPLTVHTLHGTVRALGTRFMVRQEAGRSLVVVQKHKVLVATLNGLQRTIEAGAGVRFDATQIDLPRPELLADAAWQGGVIEANGRTLMQVIAALRPYYNGVLRVSTAAGGLCVTGRYALDHVEGSLRVLSEQLPITVKHITPWLTFVDLAAA